MPDSPAVTAIKNKFANLEKIAKILEKDAVATPITDALNSAKEDGFDKGRYAVAASKVFEVEQMMREKVEGFIIQKNDKKDEIAEKNKGKLAFEKELFAAKVAVPYNKVATLCTSCRGVAVDLMQQAQIVEAARNAKHPIEKDSPHLKAGPAAGEFFDKLSPALAGPQIAAAGFNSDTGNHARAALGIEQILRVVENNPNNTKEFKADVTKFANEMMKRAAEVETARQNEIDMKTPNKKKTSLDTKPYKNLAQEFSGVRDLLASAGESQGLPASPKGKASGHNK